jgi:hypothetical protein
MTLPEADPLPTAYGDAVAAMKAKPRRSSTPGADAGRSIASDQA